MRRCRDCGEPVPGRRWKCDDCKGLAGPRTPSKAVAREREVLRLRASGLTFDQIAEQLGYADESGAWRAYKRAITRSGRDNMSLADRRELELHRLDLALNAIWKDVENGDLAAVDRVERLIKLRSRMEGMAVASRWGRGDDEDHGGESGKIVTASRVQELRERREREAAERARS